MKKIMIYTRPGLKKHTFRTGIQKTGFPAVLKSNSRMILFFTLFLCGALVGASMCRSVGSDSMLTYFAMTPVSEQYGQILQITTAETAIFCLFGLFGSFCGVGIPLLAALAFFVGFADSLTASYLIMQYAIRGLGYYCLILLPGDLITGTAGIVLCAESGEVSLRVAAAIFKGEKNGIGVREHLLRVGIIAGVFMLSAGIRCLCVFLFSKLF